MFRNLRKKKNFKKVKNKIFSSCLSFIFVLYTLIFPNLPFEKKSFTWIDLKKAPKF